jgi:hypothetical protein
MKPAQAGFFYGRCDGACVESTQIEAGGGVAGVLCRLDTDDQGSGSGLRRECRGLTGGRLRT